MGIKPKILRGDVMHTRLFPKKNAFTYKMYYISMPLSQRKDMPLSYNKLSAMSFHDKDHGSQDGKDLEQWARKILKQYNIIDADGDIVLICLPRIFGYVFNPVSFWLCHDSKGSIRAVLCEVHNTFGEQHTYICFHENGDSVNASKDIIAKKVFHVSPFLKREGYYQFRFNLKKDSLAIQINYFDENDKKQLITSLRGKYESMTKQSLRKVFWNFPLITFKTILLIHWQALKLMLKGISYISKPKQKTKKTSKSSNQTKT